MSAEATLVIINRVRVEYAARITVSRFEVEPGVLHVEMTAVRRDGRTIVARDAEPLAAATRLEELLAAAAEEPAAEEPGAEQAEPPADSAES